jgi:hypothetical protein
MPKLQWGQWSCQQCTFINESNNSQCGMCNGPRSGGGGGGGGFSSAKQGWAGGNSYSGSSSASAQGFNASATQSLRYLSSVLMEAACQQSMLVLDEWRNSGTHPVHTSPSLLIAISV